MQFTFHCFKTLVLAVFDRRANDSATSRRHSTGVREFGPNKWCLHCRTHLSMAHLNATRTEPMVVSSTSVIRGLEQLPTSTAPFNASALAWEHVLASIARVEVRLDASERRSNTSPPQSRPDPDPPYADWHGRRGDSTFQRPIITTATSVASQPQLGFGGPSSRDTHRHRTSAWEHQGSGSNWNRGKQTTAWDNPCHRQEIRGERRSTAWDSPWSRPHAGGFTLRSVPFRETAL